MSEQMEPGPSLDAKLAEAMGGWRRCPTSWDGKTVMYHKPEQHCEGENCHEAAETFRAANTHTSYSTNVGAAISAAEKCRKAGRLRFWILSSAGNGAKKPLAYAIINTDEMTPSVSANGTSPAHALVLALLAALTGDRT